MFHFGFAVTKYKQRCQRFFCKSGRGWFYSLVAKQCGWWLRSCYDLSPGLGFIKFPFLRVTRCHAVNSIFYLAMWLSVKLLAFMHRIDEITVLRMLTSRSYSHWRFTLRFNCVQAIALSETSWFVLQHCFHFVQNRQNILLNVVRHDSSDFFITVSVTLVYEWYLRSWGLLRIFGLPYTYISSGSKTWGAPRWIQGGNLLYYFLKYKKII